VGLGDLPGGEFYSIARGVSADGSVVVGASNSAASSVLGSAYSEAVRWTAQTGMVGMGFLPGGLSSVSWAASADGSVIVGASFGSPGGAFRWMAETGMLLLSDPSGGFRTSRGNAVSADGSVVVGYGQSASGQEAFLWTAELGVI